MLRMDIGCCMVTTYCGPKVGWRGFVVAVKASATTFLGTALHHGTCVEHVVYIPCFTGL